MLKNYFKIAFRNIIRHKTFSFINIFGLAVGMASTILILLWVHDELSYDKFHKDADKIYMVLREDNNSVMAVTSKLLAPALKEELAEVENSSFFIQLPETYKFLIQNGDIGFEEDVILASENFFEFFSFKFIYGNPKSVLSDPNSAVITKNIAEKYFGKEDPAGKQFKVNSLGLNSVVRVTGVIENIPPQSHIKNQIILSEKWFNYVGINHFESWTQQSFYTYIKLSSNNNQKKISENIRAVELKHYADQNKDNLKYSLLPLTDIHLYSSNVQFLKSTGSIDYVHIFILAAVLILLIAGVNYMNLSTALALKRTKEVGIKKTAGASRKSLLFQFLNESLILSLIAMLIAVLIIESLLPEFNLLTEKKLSINYDIFFIGFLLLLAVITALLSGIYPAVLLSSFNPTQILKGKLRSGSRSLLARKGLVVFQFTLSTAIIICTIVIINQLSFIRNSNPGFDKENLLCIRLLGDSNKKFEVLKNELSVNKEIINISRSVSLDAMGRSTGVKWKGNNKNEEKHFWIFHPDFASASVFKFEMKEGRFFSPEFPTDSTNAFVINESAAKSMGMKNPVNEEINVWGKDGRIIGVTKNFNFSSFHSAIEPLIFRMPASQEYFYAYTTIFLRFQSSEPDELISFIEKKWKEVLPGTPFNYYFFDESLNASYKSEITMSKVFNYFSFISILIACLGLFGLASISAEQRRKEIGVRKVLGASISNVALILSKEFLLWVILSNIIAFPAAYYFMNTWLQDFAYRIEISWWMFALAGGIALVIALATVSFQAIKAATANPVEALRYE